MEDRIHAAGVLLFARALLTQGVKIAPAILVEFVR